MDTLEKLLQKTTSFEDAIKEHDKILAAASKEYFSMNEIQKQKKMRTIDSLLDARNEMTKNNASVV